MTKKCQSAVQNAPRFIRREIQAPGTRSRAWNASLLGTEFPPSLLTVRDPNISLAGAAASLLDFPAAQQDLPTCEVAQRAIARRLGMLERHATDQRLLPSGIRADALTASCGATRVENASYSSFIVETMRFDAFLNVHFFRKGRNGDDSQ